jgi:hypothetical protein
MVHMPAASVAAMRAWSREPADASALSCGVDVNGVLDDADGDAAVGHSGCGGPPDDSLSLVEGHESLMGKLGGFEVLQAGGLGSEVARPVARPAA